MDLPIGAAHAMLITTTTDAIAFFVTPSSVPIVKNFGIFMGPCLRHRAPPPPSPPLRDDAPQSLRNHQLPLSVFNPPPHPTHTHLRDSACAPCVVCTRPPDPPPIPPSPPHPLIPHLSLPSPPPPPPTPPPHAPRLNCTDLLVITYFLLHRAATPGARACAAESAAPSLDDHLRKPGRDERWQQQHLHQEIRPRHRPRRWRAFTTRGGARSQRGHPAAAAACSCSPRRRAPRPWRQWRWRQQRYRQQR